MCLLFHCICVCRYQNSSSSSPDVRKMMRADYEVVPARLLVSDSVGVERLMDSPENRSNKGGNAKKSLADRSNRVKASDLVVEEDVE